MASIGYVHNVQPNNLSRELPTRIREVRQIHDVNYGLLISSLIITLALVALAWLVTISSNARIQQINPTHDIAQSYVSNPLPARRLMR
jgi:hypothetical protein